MASSTSRVTTFCVTTLWTSTVEASPVTVIVSSRLPMRMSTLTFAVNAAVRRMPSRLTLLKPGSEYVTL
jgi:hypothetical protein